MQALFVEILDEDIEPLDCEEFADELSDKFIGGANVRVKEVKYGKWKVHSGFFHKSLECIVCHNFLEYGAVNAGRGFANWCPSCGAKMYSES